MNKRYIYTLCFMLSAVLSLTSCLKGNDDDIDISQYDDMAITSFTLTSVNKYTTTTSSDGTETVSKTTLSSGLPVFSIDQYNHKIFNNVPLPAGCDLEHILATITTKNSGQVGIKSLVSDSVFSFLYTDSIDYSQPRELRVYALNGSGYRAYQVQVNAKEQSGSSTIVWKQMPEGTEMPTTPMAGWDFTYNAAGDGILASQDNWATVIEETLDEDSRLLPLPASASFACWNLGNGLSYALLVGNCDAQDKYVSVWRKVIDNDNPTSSSWVYFPMEADNSYGLPKLQNYFGYFLLPYTNGSVLAIDGNGNIYQSRDQGITWKTSSALQSPISRVLAASTDGNGGIWLWTRDSDLESDPGVVWFGKAEE